MKKYVWNIEVFDLVHLNGTQKIVSEPKKYFGASDHLIQMAATKLK